MTHLLSAMVFGFAVGALLGGVTPRDIVFVAYLPTWALVALACTVMLDAGDDDGPDADPRVGG